MLVITMGDPLSVNVELVSRCLASLPPPPTLPVVIVGSLEQCRWQQQALGLAQWNFARLDKAALAHGLAPGVYFVDVAGGEFGDDPRRWPIEKRGLLARSSLECVAACAPTNNLAVVTAPVNKAALVAAGFQFPGQTEYFSELWGGDTVMLLAGPVLRVGLVTTHIPLRAVASAVSADLVLRRLATMAKALRTLFNVAKPRIGVLGLNPHAGEGGVLGDEDERVVAVAVREFNEIMGQRIATGPLPADTAFHAAMRGRYDAILAMYHDQGLAPLKTMHFDEAINITAGPVPLRVSPDHGTAADLFLKGKARPTSFAEALRFAYNRLGGVDGACR